MKTRDERREETARSDARLGGGESEAWFGGCSGELSGLPLRPS